MKRNRDRMAQEGTAGRRFATVPDGASNASTNIAGAESASGTAVLVFGTLVFAIAFALVLGLASFVRGGVDLAGIACALLVAAALAASVHIAQEWERVIVLRFGAFERVVGPGLFFTIPMVESIAMRVDNRVRVTTFGAEETLTADLVPLDVDAALFWVVFDAKAACTEVGDFTHAVEMSAQTALRDAIGRGLVAEVAIRREQLDRELKAILEQKVGDWGITVLSVEVRDITLPKELQNAMSLEAQADQRRKARIILMEAESEIAEMLTDMADSYADNEAALRLRQMHLLSENLRDSHGTFVVPSSLSEGFTSDVAEALKQAGEPR